MVQPNKVALLLAVSLSLSVVCLCPRATAAKNGVGKPLVTAVTKDPTTLLYTSPIKDSHPLVLDIDGPLIWSTCDAAHATFECHHHECAHAHRYHPPSCPHSGYGKADDEDRFRCKCTAHPHNPFSFQTVTDDLTRTTLSANATNGENPLYPVSFPAVTTCVPHSMLAKLPAGAVGVAGLASSRLSLPAQVARTQKIAKKFMLCLPRVRGFGSDEGVAIFGESPFHTMPSGPLDFTASMTFTSLLKRINSPAYYLPVKAIAVGGAQLQLPGDALATGGVVFSTRVPYTTLRSDVYRPLVDAFHKASGWEELRVPAVPPFELCYNASRLPNTRIGRLAPDIDLMLQDGKNYTIVSLESMVEAWDLGPVTAGASCFGVVERKEDNKQRGHGVVAPAVEIGGFQMENSLLQFDLDKMQLGFTKLPFWTQCTQFNHTLLGH